MKVKEKLPDIFEKLQVDPSMKTFSNRKLLQKLTYLIEVFGIDLGFRFSWYIHGSYDRKLTSVLYQDGTEEPNRLVPDKYPNEGIILKKLQDFLGSDIKSSRNLELIVSLHYIQHLGLKKAWNDNKIIEILLDQKPHFDKAEAKYYLKRIKEFSK